MAFTQQDIQSLHEMLDTYANRIRADIRSDVHTDIKTALLGSEQRLREEIKQATHTLRVEYKKAIKEANEKQTQLLVEMIGSLADNLDDAYAEKQTEIRVEKISEHLRQTP